MTNKEFSELLQKRTTDFAIFIIHISSSLPKSPEGYVIRKQLSKSETSIGANYREANRARSKADFKNKIRICEAEASETVYWLNIISEIKWSNQEQIKSGMKEANELLALFTSIGKSLSI